MQKVFLQVRDITLEMPGRIIKIGTTQPVKKGWVVKMGFGQNLEGEEGAVIALTIASETTQFVSGYKDGETELWDVVMILDNEAEATELAKSQGQMTIYQIETGKLKWLD